MACFFYFQKRKLIICVNSKRLVFYTHSEDWCRVLSRNINCARDVYTGVNTGVHPFHGDEQDSLCMSIFISLTNFLSIVNLQQLLDYESLCTPRAKTSQTVCLSILLLNPAAPMLCVFQLHHPYHPNCLFSLLHFKRFQS